jgi:hypothetical protein
VDSSGPVLVSMAGSCVHGNESMTSIKFGLFSMELRTSGLYLDRKDVCLISCMTNITMNEERKRSQHVSCFR